MGVHSPADIVAGILVGICGVCASFHWGDELDDFVIHSGWSPFVIPVLAGAATWVRITPVDYFTLNA